MSNRFSQHSANQGNAHQTLAPYPTQHDDLVERMNCSLGEETRAFVMHMHVHHAWWDEALMTAVHMIHRVPNSAQIDMSP